MESLLSSEGDNRFLKQETLVQLRRILIEEEQRNPFDVGLMLKDYPVLFPPLDQALESWITSRTVSNLDVYGVSLESVMRLRRCHFLIALKSLNRLLDERVPAETRDQLRQILGMPLILK